MMTFQHNRGDEDRQRSIMLSSPFVSCHNDPCFSEVQLHCGVYLYMAGWRIMLASGRYMEHTTSTCDPRDTRTSCNTVLVRWSSGFLSGAWHGVIVNAQKTSRASVAVNVAVHGTHDGPHCWTFVFVFYGTCMRSPALTSIGHAYVYASTYVYQVEHLV